MPTLKTGWLTNYYYYYYYIIIIIIKNEKIRVTLCENAAGALYIVNRPMNEMIKIHNDNSTRYIKYH